MKTYRLPARLAVPFYLFLAVSCVPACASRRAAPTVAPVAADVPPAPALFEAREVLRQEYKISPQDVLHIAVYQESDLERDVRVSQGGKISLPLVGEVEIAGLSTLDAERKLHQLYDKYLVNPQVSVDVKEYYARQVFILGEVMKPGSYSIPSDRPLTVIGAIALAGGFTKIASPDKTRVVRHVEGKTVSSTVPVKQITSGDASKDMRLLPDDIVFIPQTFF